MIFFFAKIGNFCKRSKTHFPALFKSCLFTYPPRSKRVSSEKMNFFFPKIGIFCKSIAGSLPSIVQAYTKPYSFDRSIKLIICQIRHELSVTIHEISTRLKKKTLDGRPNIIFYIQWNSFMINKDEFRFKFY